jgi:hypothetical protein
MRSEREREREESSYNIRTGVCEWCRGAEKETKKMVKEGKGE